MFLSNDSSDIGKTILITMDIDTIDSPPISQRPYTLPLEHATWLEQELELVERAGLTTRSVSLYTDPIVVVLKWAASGEP